METDTIVMLSSQRQNRLMVVDETLELPNIKHVRHCQAVQTGNIIEIHHILRPDLQFLDFTSDLGSKY